jgi:hypothetical protein
MMDDMLTDAFDNDEMRSGSNYGAGPMELGVEMDASQMVGLAPSSKPAGRRN